jgi:AcrR family transcriptional regulator
MAKIAKHAPPQSPTLTKYRVIIAAIKLADAGGIEAMSMRKLGRELGVEGMAIYHHFADKKQLIEAMIDHIHGYITVPQGDVHWDEFMRSRAESAFEVLSQHPWAAPIMEAGANPGPATLRDSDNCIKCFREAGFSIAMTVHAVTVLNIFIYGAVGQYVRLNFSSSQEAAEFSETIKEQFPIDEYPYLGEVIMKYMMKADYYAKLEFEFGLNLILDGIARFES